MKNKMLLVSQREFLKTIRKPTFWISTLLLPVFIIIVSFLSGYSAIDAEDRVQQMLENTQGLIVIDDSGLINQAVFGQIYEFRNSSTDNISDAIEDVRIGEKPGFIHFNSDLSAENPVSIYIQDQGFLSNGSFSELANQMLHQSILTEVGDPAKIALFNTQLSAETVIFKDGVEQPDPLTQMIVPGLSVTIYFVLVLFASSYLLQSVSEEKENRMIEIMLSHMKPRELIWGKIIGQIAIVFTQLLVLGTFAAIGIAYLINNGTINIDLSGLSISPMLVLYGVLYLLAGFLIMATAMVAVSSAMPTYRDATSFSSIFILLAVSPVYFVSTILFEPSGTLAMITSYFPFTAPMILLFRSAMGELSTLELIISPLILVLYVAIGLYLSFKVFEIGSLEYTNKVSWRVFLRSIRG